MKQVVRITVAVTVLLASLGLWLVVTLRASLPVLDGTVAMEGLRESVSVMSDEYGVPGITAGSRADAFRALGYVTARDRLFQMDLMRRSTAGQLAEVLGRTVLEKDIKQRRLGLHRAAQATLERLPGEQREVLEAYAQGVNNFLARVKMFPLEFLLLGYRPQLWQPEDSLVLVLAMFQMLSLTESDERMRTVMAQSLPPEVTTFLLPDHDPYTKAILHGTAPNELPLSIPVKELLAVRRPVSSQLERYAGLVQSEEPVVGSNGWVLAGSQAADGRALLANDMHLNMAVPNIWYRVRLRYEHADMMGLVIPGIPIVVTGTNRKVAWGFTNIEGDFVDLVRLELNQQDQNQYKTPDGWRHFQTRRETIRVKGEPDVVVNCLDTIWGPVADQPLLGQPVALHWIALDPDAVNIGLLHMDRVQGVNEAVDVVNQAGGPANNVLLADADGHIAWTYTGRIPIRKGFNGSVSVSWADGRNGWTGYIAAKDLPRIVDPLSGFIVSANQRMLERYPLVIGHSFGGGYRAYRITERLREMGAVREADLFKLQLDTKSEFYEFYRDLARAVLADNVVQQRLSLASTRRAIEGWNGQADTDSVGYGLLIQFRKTLARSVFAPFLARCHEEDQNFVYGNFETPLRTLLAAQVPELLPDGSRFHDWRSFLLDALEQSARELQEKYGVTSVEKMTWGQINRSHVQHPLSGVLPGLHLILDMPEVKSPGCGQCVRVVSGSVAASERLVVSPRHPEDGILHMPGGQSGHPFSPHYGDQQPAWSDGIALSFTGSSSPHTLTLVPSDST